MIPHGLFVLFQIILCLSGGINVISYIFIAVCIVRHPTLQTVTNYFLFSTGVANILYQCMCITLIFSELCSIKSPNVFLAFLLIGMISTISNTVLVTIDTYLKVCHPFWYVRVITDRKCFLLIAFAWTIGALFGAVAGSILLTGIVNAQTKCPLGYLVSQDGIRFSTIVNIVFVPSLVIISVLKFLVIRTARKQAGTIASLGVKDAQQPEQNGPMIEQLHQKFKNIRKSTINLAIFVSTYFCGWIPLLIIFNFCFRTSCEWLDANGFNITTVIVVNLTSLGPLVYTFRQAEFSRLKMLYLQQLKTFICGRLPHEKNKVQVNIIKSEPKGETESGVSGSV